MKKVKLLGVLAASTMLLAGCNNGGGSSSSTDTSTSSSSEPAPEKPEWTEDETDVIDEVLLGCEIPCGFNAKLREFDDSSDFFFVADGDVASQSDLTSYGKKLAKKAYGFEDSLFSPEDAYMLEDFDVEFEEDSVLYYAQDVSAEGSFVCHMANVIFGREASTKKFLLIGFESYCVWDCATVENGGYGYIADSSDKTKCFDPKDLDELCVDSSEAILLLNELPALKDAQPSEYEDILKAAVEANYVFPEFAEDTINWLGVEDQQYALPLYFGSPYSKEFHGSISFIFDGFSSGEYDTYTSAIETGGYSVNPDPETHMWKDSTTYEKEVADVGTFSLETLFAEGGSGEEAYAMLYLTIDFHAVEAE